MPKGVYIKKPNIKYGGFQKGHPGFVSDKARKISSERMKKHWQDPEFRKKMSERMKNNKYGTGRKFWLEKKRSKETKIKIKEALKGRILSIKHKEKIRKKSIFQKGSLHPNWKGGITSLKKGIRECFKYNQWHLDIFQRDNWTCQKCKKRGRDLEAHHIKEFIETLKENNIKTVEGAIECKELWDINNGMTLCINCHNQTKNGRNK